MKEREGTLIQLDQNNLFKLTGTSGSSGVKKASDLLSSIEQAKNTSKQEGNHEDFCLLGVSRTLHSLRYVSRLIV